MAETHGPIPAGGVSPAAANAAGALRNLAFGSEFARGEHHAALAQVRASLNKPRCRLKI